jgi:hypothetical protein
LDIILIKCPGPRDDDGGVEAVKVNLNNNLKWMKIRGKENFVQPFGHQSVKSTTLC